MSCPTGSLTALADGALDPAERDRVLAHLAGCDACRAEVEAQRALKARLSRLAEATPGPRADLIARLTGLAVPGVEPGTRAAGGPAVPVRPGPEPVSVGPGPRRPADRRPASRRPSRRAARRTSTVGGGLLLLGVGIALMLGGPGPTAPSTPVDPASDTFVVDFVSTTSGVPLADPASRAALLPRP